MGMYYTPCGPPRPVPSGLRRHCKPSVCASRDQLGFAVGGMRGQFKLAAGGSVVPDCVVGSVFPVPVAQQAFAHLAFADEKHFAFLVTKAIDAWRIRSLEFDPRLAPGVAITFDSRHSKPTHPDRSPLESQRHKPPLRQPRLAAHPDQSIRDYADTANQASAPASECSTRWRITQKTWHHTRRSRPKLRTARNTRASLAAPSGWQEWKTQRPSR